MTGGGGSPRAATRVSSGGKESRHNATHTDKAQPGERLTWCGGWGGRGGCGNTPFGGCCDEAEGHGACGCGAVADVGVTGGGGCWCG